MSVTPAQQTVPSDDEIAQAADIIRRLPNDGVLPTELFLAVSERWVNSIVEIVPVRKVGNTVEVLLLQRPSDDMIWPGQLHTPGTVLRLSDVDGGIESAFQRIAQEELQITELPFLPVLVGYDFHEVDRGPEMALIFYVDMTGIPMPQGDWFSVNELPETTVGSQRSFIARAVDAFMTSSTYRQQT